MSRTQPQPKLKPPPRPLFTCGLFRHCTDPVLSPTATTPPASTVTAAPNPSPLPHASPPPPPQPPATTHPPHPPDPAPSSSSSSSSSASQSFTQWRFPLHHHHPPPEPDSRPTHPDPPSAGITEAFRAAEQHFASGARIQALRLLEKSISSDPPAPGGDGSCPLAVMAGVVESLRDPSAARAAAKVLLALVLGEGSRRLAVEMGAVGAALEAVAGSGAGGSTAERALAALELMCSTVEEGAEGVRAHALAGAALAGAAEGMGGRGRECAIGVMAAAWGGAGAGMAPPEVGRAVVVALQGECGARGRRKGAQLLRALRGNGRLDLDGEG